ncbi:MAG TPA: hypothetical protein VHG28_05405 [Longimicrobiaceae bacterium]|nr:hypothetical protein [Longimicrobiaceae bacterium]
MSEVEGATTPDIADGDGGRLLRMAASCPRCGSRPALRITEAAAGILLREARGTRLGTYQCQRRGCGAIYDLRAIDCVAEG